jgi:hypothetical protein
MKPSTIRGIHGILSGAFAAAQRWEWTDRNPAESAKPPTTIRRPVPAISPGDVAKVITEACVRNAALGLYLWLVVVTGVRRGELCGLQIRDIDLGRGLVHVAFNYVVRGGQRVRKDTKTHQDRWLAIGGKTLSRRLACRDRLPCGSVVTGEFRPGPAGLRGAVYRSVPRPPRGVDGAELTGTRWIGSAGTDAGHAEDQVEHAPDQYAETRPRDDVQWKVRSEVRTRQADRGGQCPGQDFQPAFQVGGHQSGDREDHHGVT